MKELLAGATLVGTIIGVGIFGIPFAAAQAGFLPAMLFLGGVAVIMTTMHVLFAEIVLRTPGSHRFVGYAKLYLGPIGRGLAILIGVAGTYAGLLAYVIISGQFLNELLPGALDPRVWSFIFLLVAMGLVLTGIKTLAFIELAMAVVLITVVFIVFGSAAPIIDSSNYAGIATSAELLFIPFGVMLFALGGLDALPGMKDILAPRGRHTKHSRRYRPIIIIGTIIPAVLALVFMTSVVGVTGPETTTEAVKGLHQFLNPTVITLLALFGFIAVFTSFLVIADNLKKTFSHDFKINPALSWFLVFIGLAILFLFITDFIGIIQFAGAAVGGLAYILVILMHTKAQKNGKRKPEFSWVHAMPVKGILFVIFGIAVAYQLWLNIGGFF